MKMSLKEKIAEKLADAGIDIFVYLAIGGTIAVLLFGHFLGYIKDFVSVLI